MYEAFFGLKEKPFSLTPNTRFLYLSRFHNEVYAHLLYGIENRSGFIMVTGEVGTGKTTILRALLKHLDENKYQLAFIFNPKLTAVELLHNINREFGIDDPTAKLPELIECLNRFLLDENRAGRVPVLVIDEAQNLSGDVLEQIRLLSNLETETDKLIQIVLVGQPELQHHLNDPSLRQLNQRIAIRYRLVPMTRDETIDYVMHRLKVAGRPDGNVFPRSSLKQIYEASGGVPRMINLLCDRAMLVAFSAGQGTVSPPFVRQAVLELAGEHEKINRPKFSWARAASVTGVFVLFAALFAVWANVIPVKSILPEVSPPPQVTKPAIVPRPPADMHSEAKVVPNKLAACNALFSSWGKPVLQSVADMERLSVEDVLAQHGFEIMKLRGTFDQLLTFDLPFIFIRIVEGELQYHAVTQKVDAGWQVDPPLFDKHVLSEDDFSLLGDLAAYMPWQDPVGVGLIAIRGVAGQQVRNLQQLLNKVENQAVPLTGVYDHATVSAVRRFQNKNGLTVDGIVGPRTLAVLYRAGSIYDLPSMN